MEPDQIQQEITIIKKMIEKTRKETAQSGHLFILIGVFSAIATLALGLLEMYQIKQFLLPILIFMALINGILGYLIVAREERREKAKTYSKTIFWHLWLVCGLTAILIVFLFPFLNVYEFRAVPVLVALIMGIAVFTTGVIYDLRFVRWSSLAWWVGAGLMAVTHSPLRFLIMVAIIILGWVLPGFLLNQQYKDRSRQNES